MKKLAENFANRSCLRTVCLGLFRDDDFDPGDDEEEAELPEADDRNLLQVRVEGGERPDGRGLQLRSRVWARAMVSPETAAAAHPRSRRPRGRGERAVSVPFSASEPRRQITAYTALFFFS